MPPSGSEFIYEPVLTPPEEPPPKRHKTLACLRCRRRKQKCDERRPCSNCARSHETCHEVVPRLAAMNGILPALQMQQLASTVDLCALEERVAQLEKAQVHSRRQWHRRSGSTSTSSSHSAAGIAGQGSVPELYRGQIFSPEAAVPVNGDYTAAAGLSFNHWGESPETNGRTWQQQQRQQQQQVGPYSSPPPSGGTSSSMATNSAPAIGLLATFARSDCSTQPLASGGIPPAPVDRATGLFLFDTYRARVHSRFAFLRLDTLQNLALSSQSPSISQQQPWTGFFTHVIYSISLLLLSNQQHQHHYRLAVTRHLGAVFAHPDRVLHAQAHLLLAMHALHSPSTERLASVSGAAARYCVTAGLHLEPEPGDDAGGEEDVARTQLRRRVFWSAYALDRSVCAALDLPPAVADAHVTTELYDAVEDAELDGSGSGSGSGSDGRNGNGPVATALRLVRCLRIASEVLDIRLRRRRDGEESREMQSVVDRLEAWGRSCSAEDMPPWLLTARDGSLAMLLGLAPSKTSSSSSSSSYGDGKGDDGTRTGETVTTSLDRVALEACARLCVKRSRNGNDGNDDWLSLITQFKSGVALLHATAFSSPSSSTSHAAAIHACNTTLSKLVERWPQAQCLRDVFTTIAAKVGISPAGSGGSGGPPTRKRKRERVKLESPLIAGEQSGARTGPDTSKAVLAQLPAVAAIVVHRPTLRMLRDLATRELRLAGEGDGEGSDLAAGAEDEEGGGEEGEGEDEEEQGRNGDCEDAVEVYNALTPAFFLPEPAPVKRDSRYDYLDFGEADDTRPWLDDGILFRASA